MSHREKPKPKQITNKVIFASNDAFKYASAWVISKYARVFKKLAE